MWIKLLVLSCKAVIQNRITNFDLEFKVCGILKIGVNHKITLEN